MSSADKPKVNPILHFVAGGVGGTIGAVLTCPLEVVKTRLQSTMYQKGVARGLGGMLRDIYAAEGVKGLWRGIGPNLVGVIPARAIYFSTYASLKHYLTHDLSINKGKESTLIHLISAASAGIATSTLTNPIWLIKTRMQLQTGSNETKQATSPTQISTSDNLKSVRRQASGMSTLSRQPQYRNSFDCLTKVIQQEGIRGLFRGLGASYLGVMEGTVQWITYEQLKKSMHSYRGFAEHEPQKASQLIDNLLLAGLAKFFAASAAYPHEVLRTRIRQVELVEDPLTRQLIGRPRYKGIVDVLRSVFREEGVMAFYGGLGAHLLRTVPNAAIMFFCYESMVFLFGQQKEK